MDYPDKEFGRDDRPISSCPTLNHQLAMEAAASEALFASEIILTAADARIGDIDVDPDPKTHAGAK